MDGLGASQLALIWCTDRTGPQLTALAHLLAEEHTHTPPPNASRRDARGRPAGPGRGQGRLG
ncbi:hypothetical protein ACL02R_06080 [Streptomyces sp. MS19]|uniref:hypothetical protein n=1 Tax=Streptomyces sp. MS19 TaxID=3385972 RepID=UPI0039A1A00A